MAGPSWNTDCSQKHVHNQQSLRGSNEIKRAKKEIIACSRIANIVPEIAIKPFLSRITSLKWLGRALTLHECCMIPGTAGFFLPDNITFLAVEEMRVVHGTALTWAVSILRSPWAHQGLYSSSLSQDGVNSPCGGQVPFRKNSGAGICSCFWEIRSISYIMMSARLLMALAWLLSPTVYTHM